jgi:hypothetical protein
VRFYAFHSASVQSGFDNLIKNGPFVSSSQMYGVSGIPANTRIDSEPFVNAIREMCGFSQITALPSWSDFTQLSTLVYQAQEGHSGATRKPEF